MSAVEVNFDGLVGPTHNYGGLARGNLASAANAAQISNPRAAALQGLAKMRALMELGLVQAVLPPHERPHIPSLRLMGFGGSDADVLTAASRAAPQLLANVSSASAMWTANAATASPSADTGDGRLHLTPANLASHFHRALETPTTARVLKAIFSDPKHFVVHDPVPFATFGDEGAANHARLTASHGQRGLELFVYGRSAFEKAAGGFAPRQALEASHIVATTHALWTGGGAAFLRQAPAAVQAGAFHNDVVAVANERALVLHRDAFDNRETAFDQIKRGCARHGFEPWIGETDPGEMSLEDAVSSYVFNSQIVTLPTGGMAMILPSEAQETRSARDFVERLIGSNGPIREVRYLDLRQSMRNGGGPACLRLRIVLTEAERAAMGAGVVLDAAKVAALEMVVRRRYRDRLASGDLADPQLLEESRTALDEIGQTLQLGSVHDFQRA